MTRGEKIRMIRLEKGMSQEQLGDLLGVRKSTIARYEKNSFKEMKVSTIEKIAEIFQVPVNLFFENNKGKVENDTINQTLIESIMNDV